MTTASHDVPTIGVVEFGYIEYPTGTNNSSRTIQWITKNGEQLSPEEYAFAEEFLRTTPGSFSQ